MTGSSFRYLIKEGFRSVWSNKLMSLASVSVLMCCLVLMGCAVMVFVNIDSLMGMIEEENVIMVYLEDETTDAEIEEMEPDLNNLDNIKEIEFVSKEEAWEEQLDTMEDAYAQFFTEISSDIPLPDSFKVTVDDLTYFDKTVSDIGEFEHIDTIRENKDLAQRLVSIRQGLEIIAVVIVVVLLAISIFIISNTIRLTVYSRRLEISIMKSVGATNGFVRMPFVVEGMILGIIAGVVSMFLVWGIYALAIFEFEDLLTSLNLVALSFNGYAVPLLIAFIVIGVLTGAGGSAITMGRYLNREGSEISAV